MYDFAKTHGITVITNFEFLRLKGRAFSKC